MGGNPLFKSLRSKLTGKEGEDKKRFVGLTDTAGAAVGLTRPVKNLFSAGSKRAKCDNPRFEYECT